MTTISTPSVNYNPFEDKPNDMQQGFFKYEYRRYAAMERLRFRDWNLHSNEEAITHRIKLQRRVTTYDQHMRRIAIGHWETCPPGEYHGA